MGLALLVVDVMTGRIRNSAENNETEDPPMTIHLYEVCPVCGQPAHECRCRQ